MSNNLRARVKGPEGGRDQIKVKCPSLYQNGKKHTGSPISASTSTGISASRLRQALLCVIVIVQFIVITKQNATVVSLQNSSGSNEANNLNGNGNGNGNGNINDRTKSLLRNANVGPPRQPKLSFNQNPIYSEPIVHPITEKSLVSRVWHSNGSPYIHPDLQSGSCWCSGDDYCMCTPSLAIDTILTSGEEHVWLVKRKDVGKYATMGGFVEVGETTAEACARELKEEMNLDLNTFGSSSSGSGKLFGSAILIVPVLEGIYADPMRDARRHTVSAVYSIEIPEVDMEGVSLTPEAGDDAAEVLRIHYDEIEHLEFFADHKTILKDFIAKKRTKKEAGKDETDPIKRDLCSQ